jgi:HK97 family phage portal protein
MSRELAAAERVLRAQAQAQGVQYRRDRAALEQYARAAFPRDPGLAEPSNTSSGTVGPDTPPSTDTASEPVVVDGDSLAAALPYAGGPSLVPSPWSGWPSAWQPAWSSGAGMGGTLGSRVSTVFSCTALNANALGSMPLAITERGRPIDAEQYGWTENPDPRLYSGWGEFMVQGVLSLLTRGDLYVHATGWDYETLLPSSFMVVDPDQVSCTFDEDGLRRYTIGGAEVYPWDLSHVRYLTAAGWPTGLSPLQGAANNLRAAGALENYGAELAEGRGIPWGVLTSEQRLTHRQTLEARRQYAEAAQTRGGAPAVLGSGLKLDTLTISPRDMALLDLEIFHEQRIAAAFGVPPYLVGLEQPGGFTYTNATSLFDFHWRGALRPLGRKITEALSAFALPRGRKVHVVAGDYVQPSLSERATSYKLMHERGVLGDDEWRALEGLPPLTPDQRTRAAAAVATATADSAVVQ